MAVPRSHSARYGFARITFRPLHPKADDGWVGMARSRSAPSSPAGFVLPASRARRRPHARRLDPDLRRPRAPPTRSSATTSTLASHLVPRFRQKLRFVPLRPGPAGLGRRPPPQSRLPRAPHGPAGARRARSSCGTSRRGSSPSASTVRSRSGSCGWSTASTATASRSSPRATTASSTASRASTSPPCSSTPRSRRIATSLSATTHGSRSPSRRPTQLLGDALLERATQPGRSAARGARAAPRPPPGPRSGRRGGVRGRLADRRRGSPPPTRRSTSRSDRIVASPGYAPTSADLKRIKDAHGGTVNDVILSVVAGALGRYLRARGHPTADLELRAMVPVSVRTAEEQGALGNRSRR